MLQITNHKYYLLTVTVTPTSLQRKNAAKLGLLPSQNLHHLKRQRRLVSSCNSLARDSAASSRAA